METKSTSPATIASIQQFSFFNPEQFETMQRVAKMFANSELVPDMYRVTPENSIERATANCIIAIDIANRINANILMVMQNLVIIYGRPSWSSKFLISTVNTCGRFNSLQFRLSNLGEIKDYPYSEYETEWVKDPATQKSKKTTKTVQKVFSGPIKNLQCIAFTSPKGSNDILESAPVSVSMALDEGWYTKKGSKWPTMTQQMLIYRAASFWTNAYAPELSMGMRTVEDIQDTIDIDYEDVTHNRKTSEKVITQEEPVMSQPDPTSAPENVLNTTKRIKL